MGSALPYLRDETGLAKRICDLGGACLTTVGSASLESMTALRVLADDLTGALDSAAWFVSVAGCAPTPCVPTFWKPPRALFGPAAIDTGTRELNAAEARATADRLACLFDDAEPAFRKIDSLLRGHVAVEIAASRQGFDHVIIAPAFPFQGRITRAGRQLVREPGGWRDVDRDLVAGLRGEGVAVARCRPGEAAPAGTSLWDAETDAELQAVVEAGRALSGRVLWCGSGGLAAALAGGQAPPAPVLRAPILALVGSDHPTSIAQLSAAWAYVHRIARGDPEEASPIARRLAARGSVAVAVMAPPGADRLMARRHIATAFAALLRFLDRPGTMFVAGGETLRAVCDCLGAERLEVDGEMVPGVPASKLRGGRWDGLRVVSKSGAFGDAGLLLRLLRPGQEGEPR
jgi:D-threonate/D-erythronate kinase